MIKALFNEFEKTLEILAPSGFEKNFLNYYKEKAEPFCDEVYFDKRGNLVCKKENSGAKKLLITAHADEIGIISLYAEENGFIRFSALGGVNLKGLIYRRVSFANGVTGVIAPEQNAKLDELKTTDLYIDVGAGNKCDAEKILPPLTVGAPEITAALMGEKMTSRAIDNKLGCVILFELIKSVKKSDYELYFCFTVEEEVGLRGAKTVGFDIEPDICLAIDVSSSGALPGAKRKGTELSKGAGIRIADAGIICNSELVGELFEAAKKAEVLAQADIKDYASTDAAALQYTKGGAKTGAIAVPVRNIHTPAETVDLNDAVAVFKTVKAFIEG